MVQYRSSLDIRRNFYKIVVHIQYVNLIRLIRRFYRLKPTEAHSVVYVERGVKNCYLNWYCIGFPPTRDVGAPSCCGFSRMKRTVKMNSESGLAALKLETTRTGLYLLDTGRRGLLDLMKTSYDDNEAMDYAFMAWKLSSQGRTR